MIFSRGYGFRNYVRSVAFIRIYFKKWSWLTSWDPDTSFTSAKSGIPILITVWSCLLYGSGKNIVKDSSPLKKIANLESRNFAKEISMNFQKVFVPLVWLFFCIPSQQASVLFLLRTKLSTSHPMLILASEDSVPMEDKCCRSTQLNDSFGNVMEGAVGYFLSVPKAWEGVRYHFVACRYKIYAIYQLPTVMEMIVGSQSTISSSSGSRYCHRQYRTNKCLTYQLLPSDVHEAKTIIKREWWKHDRRYDNISFIIETQAVLERSWWPYSDSEKEF